MSERDTRKGGTWRVLRVPDLTGRAWSSMILLIYLVDPKDHIPNVSCHYIFVVEKYECVTLVTKVTDKQTKRQIDAGEINIKC